MAETWVKMEYPGVEGTALVPLTSFNRLHKRKGWTLVDEPKPETVKSKPKKPTAKKSEPAAGYALTAESR